MVYSAICYHFCQYKIHIQFVKIINIEVNTEEHISKTI